MKYLLCLFVASSLFAFGEEEDGTQPRKPFVTADPQGVDWKGLTRESMLFLGVQHGFRLMTEPGTRNGMKGPFFRGWYNSLANLHGWADGDQFYVNYVGHPMQGSVSGFIWVQNDPKYRNAEFGKNAHYWKSRMRATAFSWAYSTQFEIGPLSEASIGKIQSRHPQQGFVDHVATPVMGLVWQSAEDALDRFVIQRFEHRVENPWARLMVRSWLNPTRSFANLMRFREPWYRDTRPGVLIYRGRDETYVAPKEKPAVEVDEKEPWKAVAPLEFTATTQYFANLNGKDALNCIGGAGTIQWNVTPHRSWVAEVGGCKMFGLDRNFSGDILAYQMGPRWTWRQGRWMPWGQVLVGGKRITIDEELPELKARVQAQNPGKVLGYETHTLYTRTAQANGFALSVGGGVDIGLNRATTLRLAGVEFNHAWLPEPGVASYPSSVKISLGILLRIGTW